MRDFSPLYKLMLVLVCLVGGAKALRAQSSTAFYVAPNGSDSAAGDLDHPFATMDRGRIAADTAIAAGGMDGVTVYFRGGRYEISQAIHFTHADSGASSSRKVVYQAYPGETPIFSGGTILSGWQLWSGSIYRAPVPAALQGILFRQLYINGARGIRARTPNVGTEWSLGGLLGWGNTNSDNTGNLYVNTSALPTALPSTNMVEVVVQHHWSTSDLRITRVSSDQQGSCAVIDAVDWGNEGKVPSHGLGQPYHFENALQFLDQPGEWYLDSAGGWIYYMPRTGEVSSGELTAQVVAPRIPTLLDIEGADATEAGGVHDLCFSGLTFQDTAWTAPSTQGFTGHQASVYWCVENIGGNAFRVDDVPPAAVDIQGANGLVFERNVVRHGGGVGIDLHGATTGNQVLGNLVTDMASSGIAIAMHGLQYGSSGTRNNTQDSNGDVIADNVVSFVGQDYPGAVGIFAGFTVNLQILHNVVCNAPYTGISLGWGWDEVVPGCTGSNVWYNDIHDVMQVLDDGGGIYTLGPQGGSLIESNLIHKIYPGPYAGGNAIAQVYMDQGTSYLGVLNNGCENNGVEAVHSNTSGSGNTTNSTCGDAESKAGLESAYSDVMPQGQEMLLGGAYGYFNGGSYGNPGDNNLAGAPAGYSTAQFLGTYNVDYNAFECFLPLSAASAPVLDFGGMYGSYFNGSGTAWYPNPVTATASNPAGSASCPAGFTATKILASTGKDYSLYICTRPHSSAPGAVQFGGIWGLRAGNAGYPNTPGLYPNPATGGAGAPNGFQTSHVFGTPNTDYDVFFGWKPLP